MNPTCETCGHEIGVIVFRCIELPMRRQQNQSPLYDEVTYIRILESEMSRIQCGRVVGYGRSRQEALRNAELAQTV